MKKLILSICVVGSLFTSCDSDDDNGSNANQVTAPQTFVFERNGNTTVSYSGQTTRIEMGEEFVSALKDPSKTEAQLDGMFTNTGDNFSDADLNSSSKTIRSKTAASQDYFSSNTTEANAIKAQFDGWIANQVNDVYPRWNDLASAGVAGQIQEAGGTVRYVNGKGLEYNQAINKGLIGALMVDQMLNNYLSTSVLDEGQNRANNDNEVLEEGKNYTKMEHKWDEAFGYLYGTDNAIVPLLNQDSFLNKYLSRVENDTDFTGIAQEIYDALKLGRAAIVAKNYEVRDQQVDIIREKVSEIVGIRAVYYLQQAKATLGTDNASAFHDLSEGFGFIMSLQFTREPGADAPYFSKSEVDGFLAQLMENDGFWDVTSATLDNMSDSIAARFDFTVAQAAN
ncbi:DUF4856 domain-containing protein [Winogradskyella sp. PC-19]|uniref:DUF4856 domain-containing protein n=1 Tax=unclassified Winogradskyella TaxID=2615021 RepID=UPI000B3C189F|nr:MULTISPECIES: DUF4856 domain-containing protein [unclassified Winogradskyella]ARV10617.1 DUF4856 domain-containing protein [Winogradskyella sp. PC-19]